MKSSYLYNPFERIAGGEALLIGSLVILITSYVSYFTGTHVQGLIKVEYAKDLPYIFFLIEHLSYWLLVTVFMYSGGVLSSKSRIRFIDVVGTMALSRVPFLILPCLRLIPTFDSFVFNSWQMYVLNAVFIVSSIWSVVLMYQSYKVSCNISFNKVLWSFIPTLILSEVLVHMMISMTLKI